MKKFVFHEDAEAEFEEAVLYYERCRKGLGSEFAQASIASDETGKLEDAKHRLGRFERAARIRRAPDDGQPGAAKG